MSDVELREIEHSFGASQILRGLNLRVESGQYVVILGASGCGKTTCLRVIAGLQKPTRGSVFIGGRSVDTTSPRHRDVTMVFQNDALYPHLTVRESMAFASKGNVAAAELSRRIDEAAALAGVSSILDRYPDRLSGGELRRAAIAKAIVPRSSVRLMDEPLSALDAPLRHSLQEDLLRWHGCVEGTTLHVTHDGQEAMRMADKIAVMEDGRIVQCATPLEIYRRPRSRSVARAIGSPPINLLRIGIGDDAICLRGGYGFDSIDAIEIGVRGESLDVWDSNRHTDQQGITVTGRVVRATRIDGALHVHAQVADSSVVAVLSAGSTLQVGQECRFFGAADQLHFFDRRSGQRIVADSGD